MKAQNTNGQSQGTGFINSIETYANAGKLAGRAARFGDWGRMNGLNTWMHRALNFEAPENRAAARAAFDNAYRDETTTT